LIALGVPRPLRFCREYTGVTLYDLSYVVEHAVIYSPEAALRGEATGLPGLRTAKLQRDRRSRLESSFFRAMEDVKA
jgi:hypothetical protein